MNRFLIGFILFIFVSCNKETGEKEPLYPKKKSENIKDTSSSFELGKEIFNGKGQCLSCHKPSQKVIGPSIIEIAQIYQGQGADMVNFLKGNAEPIVDPSQFVLMKTNLEITKKMTDEELQAIADYMYSFLK